MVTTERPDAVGTRSAAMPASRGGGDATLIERPVRILELRTVRGTGGGPEKTILHGTAMTNPDRFAITVCYVRDERDDVFRIDEWAASLGVAYVEIRERHSLDWRIWPTLRRLVLEARIDIVHAHDYKTDLLAWLLARATPAVAMATAHGWSGHSAREERVYYPADRWILGRLARVVAVSDEIRETLLAAGARPERVETIPNGIDAVRFRCDPARVAAMRAALGISPGDVVIGSAGRLGPEKRFDLLLQAFARLWPEDPRLRVVIAGDGERRHDLQRLAASLQVASRVQWLGHRTDIIDLHHAFDVFVLCSDHEGSPNAILEAMALETPVVATRVGATPEMARHGEHALLVEPGRPDALAAAIAATLRDPDATRQRVAAARHRAENELSFARRLTRVEAVYDAIMAERSGRRGVQA